MERDDIIEYSLDAHHSEEAGVKIRKKIYFVTLLLSVITIAEVLVGAFLSKTVLKTYENGETIWEVIKYSYIALTLLKAGYIVLVFMHLGDERKSFKYTILVPYAILIAYAIFIFITEAKAVDAVNFNV